MVNDYSNIQLHRSSIGFTRGRLWPAAGLMEPSVCHDSEAGRSDEAVHAASRSSHTRQDH